MTFRCKTSHESITTIDIISHVTQLIEENTGSSGGGHRVHCRTSSSAEFTSLVMDKSARGDSGEYQLQLKLPDDGGSETVTLLVNVIGDTRTGCVTSSLYRTDCMMMSPLRA